MMSQEIPGIAVGRIDQRFVLGPGESVSTIVRVDQDALHQLFTQNPKVDLEVNVEAITNPTYSPGNGKTPATMRPGVCGYMQSSTDLISRQPTPIDTPQQRDVLYQGLSSDDGGEKIRTMTVINAYLQELLNAQRTDQINQVIMEMIGHLHRVDNNGKECVLSFQKYTLAQASSGADRSAELKTMANDKHWETKLLALQLASEDGDTDMDIIQQLEGSSDAVIKDYADALSQSMQAAKAAAAAQPQAPADQSAGQPSGDQTPPMPSPETSQTPTQ
jgi:hypothetical protein